MALKPDIKGPGPVPKEALDYFRNKGLQPGFDYRDVWREEHAFGFTVAKATELDVLTTIRGRLDRAIAEGTTLAQFKKDLKPELEKLGWWGRQEMTDPLSDETKAVQLGSPRRLRTIYNANLRTAHAAAQWDRAQRTKIDRPYFLRLLGPSREHRAEHVAWHGTLLPVDHPFWDSHYGPKGYGCKCIMRQVSIPEYARLLERGTVAADRKQILDPETGLPTGQLEKRYQPVKTTAPIIEKEPWLNKRTGVVEQVPKGIDPGWDTNPGKARQQNLENLLAGKLVGAPRPMVESAVRDLVSSGRYENFVDNVLADRMVRGRTQIIGVVDRIAEQFAAAEGRKLQTPVIGLSDNALLHGRDANKADRGATISANDLRQLPVHLLTADRYWDSLDPALIYVFDAEAEDGQVGKAVIRLNYRRKGNVMNLVKTTGLVQPSNLGDPRYKKIPREGD